ncbi:MAG: hypothetical protein JKY03_01245 [Aureispira sp.]|nr:hypothetical protein [Aureispira sp.]
MLRFLMVCFLGWISFFSMAQQNDPSVYTVDKSRDFTASFSLEWEYPSPLKEILPIRNKNSVVNWHKVLTDLEENQAQYKTLVLPQKEALASCALMLVLLDKEAYSEFYKTKTTYLQLLQERLSAVENDYLETCLKYLEQQNSPQQIIKLWQVYFHYTTNGHQALYAAENLLAAAEKITTLPIEEQEDLIATVYYLVGAVYADRGEYMKKKKYYNLCYELRKKRGDDLYYSLTRVLNNNSPDLEQRKVLFKDLLNSIQEHGCRNDKKLFQESINYLLENKEYDLALELFEKGTLKYSCLQDLEKLSHGNHCPYLYLAVETLSKGSTFDDSSQDSIAMNWFKKWLTVLDTLAPENAANTPDYIKFEEQYYLNYTDRACTRIVDFLLYYGKNELAKEFFETHQKPIYFTPNTNPNIIYNFNCFYYKFIPHHSIALNDSLVLLNLKDYLDLSYDVIKGEEQAKTGPLGQVKRGRESIAWLGQKTATTASYLQYLEYWLSRAKQLNYSSEEILAHQYYCAALRKDQQYVKALEFSLKFKRLTRSKTKNTSQEYALRVRAYFLDNVLNHYEIDSKERQKAMLIIKKRAPRKDKKWSRIALKKLQRQAPY